MSRFLLQPRHCDAVREQTMTMDVNQTPTQPQAAYFYTAAYKQCEMEVVLSV